jgi:hypothetical protein
MLAFPQDRPQIARPTLGFVLMPFQGIKFRSNKNYAALGVSPAKLIESMQLSFFIHVGETPALPAANR